MDTLDKEFIYIPDRIIQKINAATNLGEYYFDGTKAYNAEVLKANTLTCNPRAIFKWQVPNASEVVIYVNKLVLNEPNVMGEICKLDFITMFGEGAKVAHDGEDGIDGENKPTQPNGSGLKGEDAEHGSQGGEGKCQDMPTLYLIYNEIVFVKGIGGVNRGLSISGAGLDGGNGGRGGKGGDGGEGARGKDGSSNSFFECTAGPGLGASGGNAGSGGKGGKAGKGSDGLDIIFLGPVNKSQLFHIVQPGGKKGNPGPAGYDGRPGRKGTFGTKPSVCPGYPMVADSVWNDGKLVANPLKTIGDTNIDGTDGLNYYSDDFNAPSIIFSGPIHLAPGVGSKGKYVIPGEKGNELGFKKILPFDFEDVLLALEDFRNVSGLSEESRIGFQDFKNELTVISASVTGQGLNAAMGEFSLGVRRALPIGKKFYNNDFFDIVATLDLGAQEIQEVFQSYYTVVDDKKLTISVYSKFLFNDESYGMEKNILGHRLEKALQEKLAY